MHIDEFNNDSIDPQRVQLRLNKSEIGVLDVLDMQHAVRQLYLGKKKRSSDQRREALHRWADDGGNVVIKGVVCEANWFMGGSKDGRVSRFCLLFPAILTAPGEWTFFDTHMWLKPQCGIVPANDFDFELPSGDVITCHMPDNGMMGQRFTVCLGDTLVLLGHVSPYRKDGARNADGVESFGFDSWVPVAGGFILFEGADGAMHSAPRALMSRESFIMGFKPDGEGGFDRLLGTRGGIGKLKQLLDGREDAKFAD